MHYFSHIYYVKLNDSKIQISRITSTLKYLLTLQQKVRIISYRLNESPIMII